MFDVAVAGNGLDALNAVRKANDEGKPFGLVILDWKMPHMNGLELAEKLRGMSELRITPKVLLITGYGENEVPLPAAGRLVDGVLEKPFQQSKLFDAVAKISGWDNLETGKFRMVGAQFNPVLVSRVRGARLLLVEDDEINQQVAREMLESFGIQVTLAENGKDAIALLGKETFDGVLMDMQMPVMDGISAARAIRKNPQLADLPIIALTANVMVREQTEILAAGMNDHIGKPIDPDRLVAILAKWVRPSRAAAGAAVREAVPVVATEPLPNLLNVKVAASVRRMGGNVDLYYSLLEKFKTNQAQVVANIREALAANDTQTAERLAHTLRGIAGTLGDELLPNVSGQLENDIKNGSLENLEILLTQVAQEVSNLIAEIERALESRST
jgi:two-component system sensor histidine kinase/response regulator